MAFNMDDLKPLDSEAGLKAIAQVKEKFKKPETQAPAQSAADLSKQLDGIEKDYLAKLKKAPDEKSPPPTAKFEVQNAQAQPEAPPVSPKVPSNTGKSASLGG